MAYRPDSYTISKIIDYGNEVKLFRVETGINPMPGQFIEVSIPGIGECPLASCSYERNHVDMLTRKAGNVTSSMFQKKVGDKVFIRGPYGKGFPVKKLQHKNIVLVAGGTGIAPITSMIDYIDKNRDKFLDIKIYFGFRDIGHVLLRERIEQWNRKFRIVLCIDNLQEDYKTQINTVRGFIHSNIDCTEKFQKNTYVLMCGPEVMMKSVTNKLKLSGVKANKIYWSVERRMECGIGSCNRCMIQDLYVCRDGPVFRYDIINPRIENEESSNIGPDQLSRNRIKRD